jgi:uncharacterized membrane protein YtjA (UPF0391 family)
MQCPRCDSNRVFRSRSRSLGDRAAKRLLRLTWLRCHDCNWRRPRFLGGAKGMALHILSIAGYAAGAGLVLFVISIVLTVTLSFLGIQLPWRH